MSGRVIVVQASSSEDESMSSPVAGGGDGSLEFSSEVTNKTTETTGSTENKVCYRYDRDDMLKLYNHPSAKVRPAVLSPEFDMVVENGEGGNGDATSNHKLWSPELWIQSIWNPEPRQNSSMAGSGSWSGRRPGDHDGHGQPLSKKKQIDRLKTESEDGIVLSPQRRSFGAGCQVASSSVAATANVVGSQTAAGVGVVPATQLRRSTSPVNGGGDDRQQPGAPQTIRSSFRSRGGASTAVSVPVPPAPQVQTAAPVAGHIGYGRGDRVENWRDRSGYSSNSFGRGNMGKDAPAPLNTYARSRGGGTNAWNTGGNRRSYGGGGGYHHEESLPEWVTEGPSDMFETMELRGFDEEERQEMQMEQNNGMAQKRGPGRVQQWRPSTGYEFNGDKDQSARRSIERNEQSQSIKRDNKGDQSSRKSAGDGDRTTNMKMPAEALVDGFDIGDMAQFLSVAAADFDSISNGEIQAQGKTSSVGKVAPVPATPTAASRFSKFFAPSGQNAGNGRASSESKSNQGSTQKGQQQQSVNIMDLFSKAAVASESGQAKAVVSGTPAVPAGAKSLDEIEAAYKSNVAQKSGHAAHSGGSPNKVLQELFQSARSDTASQGSVQDARLNLESHQKGGDVDKQPKVAQLPEQMTQQQALEMLQKGVQNMANSIGGVAVKGNPLADPAQQQHFLDALRKLHIQQQQFQLATQQQHGDMAHRHPNATGANEAANPFLAAYPQLAGLQHLLQQQQQALQMGNLQAALNSSGRVPSPLGVLPGVVQAAPQQGAGAPAGPNQTINPAFVGMLPPANVPPPPITQHDLLLAHTQSIYQRALMTRKLQQGIEEQQPPPKPSVLQPGAPVGGGKLPTAFLPTSVIKQMHGGMKPSKDGDESNVGLARPIVKQQAPFGGQQEQVSPNSANEHLIRNLQQQNASKPILGSSVGGNAMQQPMAPPPSLTPQDLQRLIDQSQRQQRQHQERVLLEQYAKAQQQVGNNPNAVTAALALQNNPVFVQMLKAQAMQQQMAMLQQQAAAAAAGSGLSQAPQQTIPASAAVSAIPNAAQLVRARLAAPSAAAAATAPNPELMRHVFQQQQQQQMLLHQLRQQAPTDANLLNRLLTGQSAQHQMSGVPSQSTSSMAGLHYPAQGMVDVKPMTLEELERLHKQSAAMQQPQS